MSGQAAQVHWTEYLAALGPVIIAVIVAYIAFEQWRIARANFREKLFDRRYELYNLACEVLLIAYLKNTNDTEVIQEFRRKRRQARFLFEGGVADFLNEILDNAVKCFMLDNRFNQQVKGEHQKLLDKTEEDIKEVEAFISKALNEIDERMMPALNLYEYEVSSLSRFLRSGRNRAS